MKKTIRILKDESGIALLMAIFTVTVLMIIATEVMYETNVELIVSSQAVNQVKAHYAAKAGIEISLLRIQIFRKASALLGDTLGEQKSMLDMIWQMPFAWPPVVPPDTSLVDKGEIKKAVKSSKMEGQYFATIESEGGKIDVNDLDSPSKVVAASTRQQLLDIWNSKVENDEEFQRKHRDDDFTKIVDALTDWIDADKVQHGGSGEESALYPDRANENIPPNAPFKTMEELHMVAGMTDEIYNLLAPRLTVYGTKGVNVNYAKKDVIMSLSTQITSERADKVIEDRAKKERGPFKDEKDFVGYLNSIGVNGNPFRDDKDVLKVPLLFDPEFNFRIRSTGQAGRVQKDITAIVYDVDRVTLRLHDFLSQQAAAAKNGQGQTNGQPPAGQDPNEPNISPEEKQRRLNAQSQNNGTSKKPAAKPTVPNERPNIVYWNET